MLFFFTARLCRGRHANLLPLPSTSNGFIRVQCLHSLDVWEPPSRFVEALVWRIRLLPLHWSPMLSLIHSLKPPHLLPPKVQQTGVYPHPLSGCRTRGLSLRGGSRHDRNRHNRRNRQNRQNRHGCLWGTVIIICRTSKRRARSFSEPPKPPKPS